MLQTQIQSNKKWLIINLHYRSRTYWWKYRRGAGSGQRSCNRGKWLIIRNCCIMHAEMLSGWLENSHSSKPIWLPVRGCGPYRIWIKRISRAEKQFHTDFTLNCQHGPSCVGEILITLTHNGKIWCSLNGKQIHRGTRGQTQSKIRIWMSFDKWEK